MSQNQNVKIVRDSCLPVIAFALELVILEMDEHITVLHAKKKHDVMHAKNGIITTMGIQILHIRITEPFD